MSNHKGPYEVSTRDASSGIRSTSEWFWYIKGPGHSYNGGYMDTYANLFPVVEDPATGRSKPPPDIMETIARLMNDAYWRGHDKKAREVKEVLGIA